MAKTIDEMNLIDDFLMTAVAVDEEEGAECCRIILSANPLPAMRICASTGTAKS